jgi:hypothetical protein
VERGLDVSATTLVGEAASAHLVSEVLYAAASPANIVQMSGTEIEEIGFRFETASAAEIDQSSLVQTASAAEVENRVSFRNGFSRRDRKSS